ncbi:MAG: hypothetical protein WAW17_19435, partial [Rhodococcus sp. (in: high G+C Gram-positive bacteria)]
MPRDLAAFVGGAIFCAGLIGMITAAPVVAESADGAPGGACSPWRVSEVTSTSGILENLAFDGRGSMVISRLGVAGNGGLDRVTADGAVSVLVPDVESPGGIAVAGNEAYFATGNSFIAGVTGSDSGT